MNDNDRDIIIISMFCLKVKASEIAKHFNITTDQVLSILEPNY